MKIEIDKGIPIPEHVNPKLQSLPVGEMKIGDSIFVPHNYVSKTSVRRYFGKIGTFKQFKCTDDIIAGEPGVRVWKLK